MSDHLESELEKLVANAARELAREIKSHIMNRLGVAAGKAAAPKAAKPAKAAKAAPAPKAAAPKAAPAPAAKPAAKKAAPAAKPAAKKAAAKAAPAAPKAGKRGRSGGGDKSAVLSEVERLVTSSDGVGLGEIERKSKLGRSAITLALRALKEQGRIYMGGTRRFARYAGTQAAADRANIAARKSA